MKDGTSINTVGELFCDGTGGAFIFQPEGSCIMLGSTGIKTLEGGCFMYDGTGRHCKPKPEGSCIMLDGTGTNMPEGSCFMYDGTEGPCNHIAAMLAGTPLLQQRVSRGQPERHA